MEEKKYSLRELSKSNKTYNEMIEFLKKTIPQEKRPEIIQKFEEKAFEDDDRGKGLKWMLNINGLATATSLLAIILGNPGVVGATVVTAPYTLLYYFWCKNVMQQAKENKEECLRFIQSVSEKENDIRYPFVIGNDEDLKKMQEYSKSLSDKNGEGIIEYFKNLVIDEEKSHI